VFLWVFARLPREPVTWRSAIMAAAAAAIGLEVIKGVMGVYLAAVTQTPAGLAFPNPWPAESPPGRPPRGRTRSSDRHR
jgi:hypothetical protein